MAFLLGSLIVTCWLVPNVGLAASTISYDPNGSPISQQPVSQNFSIIVTQPLNRLAESNGNAGFSVNVSSVSPVTYQWRFNGTNILGATGDSLYLPVVTSANEGSYTVVISNASGSVTSTPAFFSIDSNANGMADAWESSFFGNLNQSPFGDYDGDSISNLDEFLNGTDPTVREVYYWVAASGNFNGATNWSRNRVPGAGDTAVITNGTFTLPTSGTIAVSQVTVGVPFTTSASADTTLNVSGTWSFTNAFTLASSRQFNVTGGGNVIVTGPTTITGAGLFVYGNNTKLTLHNVTSYSQPTNINVRWQAGDQFISNLGCELNFPALQTITGSPTTVDFSSRYFDLAATRQATLNLPALTNITAQAETMSNADSGVRLNASNGGVISAGVLNTFNDLSPLGHSYLTATDTGRLVLPLLTVPSGVQMNLNALSTPQQFNLLPGTWYFRLNAGVVALPLTNVNGITQLLVDGDNTKLTFPNVANYSQPTNTSVLWQAGDQFISSIGCELNFPALRTITGSPVVVDFVSHYFNLTATRQATLNLPALTNITALAETMANADSGVRLNASSGGVVNAGVLSAFNDHSALGHSFLTATDTGRLVLPLLTAPSGVQMNLNALSTPQQFIALPGTWYFRLNAGTVEMPLTNINGIAQLFVDGDDTKLTFPNVASYNQPTNVSVRWQAGDQFISSIGCELNFPALETIVGSPTTVNFTSRYLDIAATRQAVVNLPLLTNITALAETMSNADSGVRLNASNGGVINAPLLSTFQDLSAVGHSSLTVIVPGRLLLPSLRLSGVQGVTLNGLALPSVPPLITSGSNVTATFGNYFRYQITASNVASSFGASGLPAGLSLDTDSGLISGYLVSNGVFPITLNATNAVGTTNQTLILTISNPVSISPPAELVGWWPSDGSTLDLVGTNHGTLVNGTSYATGKVAMSFSLDGIDDRVRIPESANIDISRMTNWTIEGWVRPTSFTSQSWPTIYSEGRWAVSLGMNNSSGKLESWINNGNQLVGTIALQLSNWNHVALIFNGASRTFYLDGEFAGSGSAPAITPDNTGSAIGDTVSNPNSSRFPGQVDELSIYNRTLSANEISAIHAAGFAGKTKPEVKLSIRLTNGLVELTWPLLASSGYELQTVSALSSSNAWQIVNQAPTTNGAWKVLTLPVGAGASYYRLRRP